MRLCCCNSNKKNLTKLVLHKLVLSTSAVPYNESEPRRYIRAPISPKGRRGCDDQSRI
jgi:hypothetical protein